MRYRRLFDFDHEVSLKELKKTMNGLLKESDEESLRFAVKILRAVAR